MGRTSGKSSRPVIKIQPACKQNEAAMQCGTASCLGETGKSASDAFFLYFVRQSGDILIGQKANLISMLSFDFKKMRGENFDYTEYLRIE